MKLMGSLKSILVNNVNEFIVGDMKFFLGRDNFYNSYTGYIRDFNLLFG